MAIAPPAVPADQLVDPFLKQRDLLLLLGKHSV
jgi:hypothetical protein